MTTGAAGLDKIPNLSPRLRIQTSGWLVQKNKLWPADDCRCHSQSLPLAARHITDSHFCFCGQPHHFKGSLWIETRCIERAKKPDRLPHGQLVGEPCFLKRRADLLAQLLLIIFPREPEHLHVTAAGGE